MVTYTWISSVSGKERYYTKFIGPSVKEAEVRHEADLYALKVFHSKNIKASIRVEVSPVEWKVVSDG